MAVNPLIIYVGLSVTTLVGLVAVVQQNKTPSKPVAAVVQSQLQKQPLVVPLVTPATKAPLVKSPAVKSSVKNPLATKKLASLPPKQPPKKQIVPKASKADAETVPVAPSFDMVRVEKDGGTVVLGKAAPGASVLLKLNGKTIGQTTANAKGDWVFVPDELVPQGSNELIVEATGQDKKTVRSKQSIFIAMPKAGSKKAGEKPLIVVAKPDAPTRVLQQPEAKTEPVKSSPPKVKVSPAKPVKTAPEKTVKTAKADPPEKQNKAPAIVKQPVEKLARLAEPKKPVEQTKSAPVPAPVPEIPKQARLTFGTVDYNDTGEIVFTGKATPGSTVRLYVDNTFVGDAITGASGGWVFRGNEKIKPGERELRADQLSPDGKVAQRTAVPFVRANREKVAALLKIRKKASKTEPAKIMPQPEKPVAAKPEPAVKPAIQREVAKIVPAIKTPAPVLTPVPAPVLTPVPAPVSAPEPATPTEQVAEPETITKTTTATNTEPDKPQAGLVSQVVIQPGNNLWNISRVIYGKGIAYTTIYQANQDQIKNPDRIYPGQIFTTPGATSTGSIDPDQREPQAGLTGLTDNKTTQN